MRCFLLVLSGLLFCGVVKATEHVYSNAISTEQVEELRAAYDRSRGEIEAFRKKESLRYRKAQPAERREIVKEVRRELEKSLRTLIFPAWYGTEWDFNGISAAPGKGKIACGYFVSTCMTHLGFKVSRIRLAQQPSQRIIETFMPKSQRKILAGGLSMEKIRAYLKKRGDGIYIVGLDTHVGFVSVEGDDMAFVHSSYFPPGAHVKAEKIDSHNPLSFSRYHVLGKILSDDMVRKWLSGHQYSVKR